MLYMFSTQNYLIFKIKFFIINKINTTENVILFINLERRLLII
jgi:hypothetical protein